MKIAVLGTGHVGLITCVTFAHAGHDVIGNDIDESKIADLTMGISPFYEPGLDELLTEGVSTGRLRFTSDTHDAVRDAGVIFICVGTPARSNGEANLLAVERAARSVARSTRAGVVVVEKSTVPAGTADRVTRTVMHERPDIAADVHVVSNPEFLREGSAIVDSLNPERILVGADSEHAFQ